MQQRAVHSKCLISAKPEKIAALDFDISAMAVRPCSMISCDALRLRSDAQLHRGRLIMAVEACLSREPISL